GVGMLLYLVKLSRLDIGNCVRELSKMLSKPTRAAMKEMFRCIKYVLDTSDYGLRIVPKELIGGHWHLVAYTDSDWAGDKDTRRSVSGFIIYLMDVPILWRSRQQRSVTLSSTEAEYVSLSEAAKEIKFVYQIMTTMGFQVKTPITVMVDNVGAIFMSENVTTSQRTRHVDIRYAYLREMVIEEGFLEIKFVRTRDNLSDGMTKNVTSEIQQRHSVSHVMRRDEVYDGSEVTNRKGVRNEVLETQTPAVADG
ncbi:MAG: Ty1/Copia family ribonuclease HI, partial [Bacteroidota bacterium]